MEYSILDSSGKVVATASSASEAKTKLQAGQCVFGQQTIVDERGARISEAQLDVLCEDEAAGEQATADQLRG